MNITKESEHFCNQRDKLNIIESLKLRDQHANLNKPSADF